MKQLILFLSLLSVSLVFAERTVYVSDNLSTAVRSGTSNEYRILFYVPAGMPLTLLDEPATDGYVKVRDDRGREGWTLERFITDTKGARVELAEVKEQLAAKLIELEKLKQDHQVELNQLIEQLDSAKSLSARAESFQREISELQTQNSTLEQQNRRMNDRYLQEWFFAGGAVILVGIFVGVIFGRMSRKKNSGWS